MSRVLSFLLDLKESFSMMDCLRFSGGFRLREFGGVEEGKGISVSSSDSA